MRKIIHVSDIHFGRTDSISIRELGEAFKKVNPDLIIISGDITQRAHVKEFEAGQKFLRTLKKAGLEYFVIPGNHDIVPFYKPISRLLNPYDRYKKYISPVVNPVFKDTEIAVASINTVRASSIKDGRVNLEHLEQVATWFAGIPEDVFKIVVTHHPLDLPLTSTKKILAMRAKAAIYRLAKDKIDMYLSGHYHQSSTVPTSLRYKAHHYPAIAVQAGTVSLRQRQEAQSFNVLHIDKINVTIETHIWNSSSFVFDPYCSNSFVFKDQTWQSLV